MTTRRDQAEAYTHVVYVVRRVDECLYVGMSSQGLARVFSSNHHIFGGRFSHEDTIEVVACRDRQHALTTEAALIDDLRPTLNKTRPIPPPRLIWCCSYCIQEGLAEAPPMDRRTDGICDRHLLEVRLQHFAIPRLHGVVARLNGASYLGADARRALAEDVVSVIATLEKCASPAATK